jgi:hypothetical protein
MVFDQVHRWGLDDFVKTQKPEELTYSA